MQSTKSTKQRIVEAAIQLYNERGVSNVSLRDIGQVLDMSPGNLAYHFANHDYIITEAFRQMEAERDEILRGVQQIPTFENINQQIQPLLEIGGKYLFFQLDAAHILRNYPDIAQLQRQYFESSIKYVKAVIDLSVGNGNCQREQTPGQFQRLAHTVWMLMNFWLEQKMLRGQDAELEVEEVRRSVWDLVYPHLTEKGKHQLTKLHSASAATI
jgi:AcrR family transcriptional regulator